MIYSRRLYNNLQLSDMQTSGKAVILASILLYLVLRKTLYLTKWKALPSVSTR